MIALCLALTAVAGAAGTLAMTLRNLAAFAPPTGQSHPSPDTRVSVCIPARNEQANLRDCVASLLAQVPPPFEILVYDDQSTDDTPAIVQQLCAENPSVQSVRTVPLPPGWNGKQHACAQMGFTARGNWLVFTDADVRFEPDALRRTVAMAQENGLDLLSGFPRQITGSAGERLLVPMIFFLLLSYLPLGRMRTTTMPSASAGCGQFLLVATEAYRASGGHTAFPASMHDGIQLPRHLRRRGARTDLCDTTELMHVRMYHGARDTWAGFAKNAYEGLGSFGLLVFLTVFHALAFVLPWPLLLYGVITQRWAVAGLAAAALTLAVVQRIALCRRFAQPNAVALLHPFAVALMTLVQWHSFALAVLGRRTWRGRTATTERVILVDEQDNPVGDAEKIAVHRNQGQLHRAFSVMVYDAQGRVLLQRRAPVKYHFAGRWANSCCGHPRPGESAPQAGRRRLNEELGLDIPLHAVTTFTYRARDTGSGLIEHEIDHVLAGHIGDQEPAVNPLEADAVRWLSPEQVETELQDHPDDFAPWFAPVWQAIKDAPRDDQKP